MLGRDQGRVRQHRIKRSRHVAGASLLPRQRMGRGRELAQLSPIVKTLASLGGRRHSRHVGIGATGLEERMTADRLDRFARAWVRCDLDELRSYLTEDALYSPLSGEVVRGREAVVRRFAEVLADDRGCDLRFEPSRVSGSFGVCRWRLAGRTPEGGLFAVEGVDVYEFSGSLIRVKDVYQKA